MYSDDIDDKYKGICFFLYMYVHYKVYGNHLKIIDFVSHSSHGYIIVKEYNHSLRNMYIGKITESEIIIRETYE